MLKYTVFRECLHAAKGEGLIGKGHIYRYLRSVKLALLLTGYIGVTAALATLVPQGRDPLFYKQTYNPLLYRLFMATGFTTYYTSLLFLIPLSLFFINLSLCTLHRIATRFKSGAAHRFGPDIVHIGLLLLMAGALITTVERKSALIYLETGGSAILPGNYHLTLTSFEFLKYKDNRPKDWLSHVHVTRGNTLGKNFTIEVNKPLKLGTLKVYQYTYTDKSTVLLQDSSGNTKRLLPGYYFKDGNAVIAFKRVAPQVGGKSGSESMAFFDRWIGNRHIHEYKIPRGGSIAGFKIVSMHHNVETGLKIIKDPGVLPVFLALLLITFGLGLTFVQKLGDNAL